MNKYGKEIFENIPNELGAQKIIEVSSVIKIYYGMNNAGNLRLSFMSSVAPPKMDSTKLLKVVQGKETDKIYWTNFDLLESTAKQVFYSFCNDLIKSVDGVNDEKKALVYLKNRFHIWKSMFKKNSTVISVELVKGLFGELYFLDTVVSEKYGITEAICSWSGADGTAKDFSINMDWIEVKVVSTSAVSVKISSISQLSSETPGHLVIIKLESMSPVYSNGKSSIGELFYSILQKIELDETKELFLGKLLSYGISLNDDCCSEKFNAVSVQQYRVDEKFPRLLEEDIKYKEICKVSYELIINSLERFKEA
ncbi:MAG: PD-(D/E)XK motif protein [Defluviitaleaceae bacterium]|nr:PD-(D/E)XK motif protein [Defluviitaleaceae bacterium]